MPIMPTLSNPINNADNSERVRQHADILRITVILLERRGLIRRLKVLSGDGVVTEIRLVLSPDVWSDDLRLLSK